MRYPGLGGQCDAVAAATQQVGEHALGFTACVAVGGVDVGDPGFEGRVEHRGGTVTVDGVAERHGAQHEGAEFEHQATPLSSCRGLTPTMVVGSSAAARSVWV